MEEIKTKVCSKCKRELPITEFHRNKATVRNVPNIMMRIKNNKKSCCQCTPIPNFQNFSREIYSQS